MQSHYRAPSHPLLAVHSGIAKAHTLRETADTAHDLSVAARDRFIAGLRARVSTEEQRNLHRDAIAAHNASLAASNALLGIKHYELPEYD